LQNKIKPRGSVIAELKQRKSESLERASNQDLDEHVREHNSQSADETDRHIKLLELSLK